MYSPNILITNFCNQNCSFCFASVEMSSKAIDREMELSNFHKILIQMKKTNTKVDTVKLLGGEPTLHSRLEDIIKLSLDTFSFVQIFTNGIFPKDKVDIFHRFFPKLKFTFNVMTPSFQLNQKVRQIVIDTIREFSTKTEVTLSFTVDSHTDVRFILSTLPVDIIRSISCMRIGFANPIAGEKNTYSFEEFPVMGRQLYTIIRYVKETGSKAKFFLNCGFTRCMFTKREYQYLLDNGIQLAGWGCFGKTSSMDVATNMTAFHCFPLSTKNRIKLTENNITSANSEFLKQRYEYWNNIHLAICKKCPFYGHTPDKCPGPCLAFRLNDLNISK